MSYILPRRAKWCTCSLVDEHIGSQMLMLYSEPGHAPGDFRMYFGENPDKVKNIVTSTLGRFQDLYAPALKVWQAFC